MILLPKVVAGFTLTWQGMQLLNTRCHLEHQPHSDSEAGVSWSEITKGNDNSQNTSPSQEVKADASRELINTAPQHHLLANLLQHF